MWPDGYDIHGTDVSNRDVSDREITGETPVSLDTVGLEHGGTRHGGRGSTMTTDQAGSPLVGLIMGSDSDWRVMSAAGELLDEFGVSYEVGVSPRTARRSGCWTTPLRPPVAGCG